MMANAAAPAFEVATFRKIAWRIIPLLFLAYITAFLDRVNVGFAKLQMAGDLHFSDAVYGFGAGIFFIGYFIFEVPSNMILRRVGARVWMARIMVTWGIISTLFLFTGVMQWGPIAPALGCTDQQLTFYVLRFLLGAAEAGFFPGMILYLTFWFPARRRTQMVAIFMTGVAFSSIIGSPLSGAILQYMDGVSGQRGWQWLFVLEGLPSVAMGGVLFFLLSNTPGEAKWLNDEERALVHARVAEEEAGKGSAGQRHSLMDAFADLRVWLFGAVYFSAMVCQYAVNFWLPTIVSEFGAKDFLSVGLISMIPWGVTAIVQILWARHSDQTGERRWHCIVGLMVAMTGLLMLAFVHGPTPVSLLSLTLTLAGSLSCVVTFWALPTSFLSGAAAAGGIALINSIGNLGGYLGPDMIGRIRDANGGKSDMAFLAMAGLALVGAVLVLVATSSRPRAVQAAAAE